MVRVGIVTVFFASVKTRTTLRGLTSALQRNLLCPIRRPLAKLLPQGKCVRITEEAIVSSELSCRTPTLRQVDVLPCQH
ncbi:hypothetical protein B0F90DRAFT_1673403 [Multifurca ochricompacta]|uniref:Uncharacterized protein n=1 Tax=Multifurca ochricompacta TaxID=376703 RepID=A0AAD4ME38_9AGAM|nr:hypothetical protein B0F90DRAFT_1673403 [Multifurca ochricompacta]